MSGDVSLVTLERVHQMLPLIMRIGMSLRDTRVALAAMTNQELQRFCGLGGVDDAEESKAERNRLLCEARDYSEELGELGGRVMNFMPIAFGFNAIQGGIEGVVFWRLSRPDELEFLSYEQVKSLVGDVEEVVG